MGPLPPLASRLSRYEGGALRARDYGASATYGLGEVHVLAFDPTTAPGVDDPWVLSRVLEMVGRAWDRRADIVMPLGTNEPYLQEDGVPPRARPQRELPPRARALARCCSSSIRSSSAPCRLLRAAKVGKPLAPLVWAPLWSAGTVAAIVVVGLASKGWGGRARHLSLVEAGSGMSKGPVRRYRGFFSSSTRSLGVVAQDRGAVLDLLTEAGEQGHAVLREDRDGATLGEISSLPWQTVVVREDAIADLKGGISLVERVQRGSTVVNLTGRAMKDVIVVERLTAAESYFFATVNDGQRRPARRRRTGRGDERAVASEHRGHARRPPAGTRTSSISARLGK